MFDGIDAAQWYDPEVRHWLVALAGGTRPGRGHLTTLLSVIVSAHFETPQHSAHARAAVIEHLPQLLALARDTDPLVRAPAYLTLGRCGGPAEVLWRQLQAEQDRSARIALLIALGAVDRDRAAAVLATAVYEDSPATRLAAMLALHRAGQTLPAGTAAALAEAVEAGVRGRCCVPSTVDRRGQHRWHRSAPALTTRSRIREHDQ